MNEDGYMHYRAFAAPSDYFRGGYDSQEKMCPRRGPDTLDIDALTCPLCLELLAKRTSRLLFESAMNALHDRLTLLEDEVLQR